MYDVLVVSCNPDNQLRLKTLFSQSEHFTLHRVSNCDQAVDALQHRAFDAVISEINVGRIDGWRLARLLRAGVFKTPDSAVFCLLSTIWCEQIAETTARAYDIDLVLPTEQVNSLSEQLLSLCERTLRHNNLPKILVVEDDPDIAELADRILHRRYHMIHAQDGEQAMQRFAEHSYGLVLLDIMLPKYSGQSVLEHIMAHNPQQPVVAMTAHGGADLAVEMMFKGAADFISKPFRAEQLRRVVDVACQRQEFMASNQQFADKVQSLQASESRYRQLSQTHQRILDHLATVVMELDEQGHICFINNAWKPLSGFSVDASITRSFTDFIADTDAALYEQVTQDIRQLLSGKRKQLQAEFMLSRENHDTVWVLAQFNSLTEGQQTVGFTLTLDNIDERKQAEQQLQHLATHDTLTGLYNRYYFDRQLHRLASLASQQQQHHAMLYIDLDHFKVINDSQGHNQGDAVLKEVASRLGQFKQSHDILCRIGGDEFALLLVDRDQQEAESIASELCNTLQDSHYHFEQHTYKISCSIGIALIHGQEANTQNYLQQADIALYVAKRRGRNLAHTYTPEDKASAEYRNSVEWTQMLQEAIVRDSIIMHFQPVVTVNSGKVAYVEALVRLQLEDEMVPPGVFIPALERAEDMYLLDHQVIAKTIAMMSRHKELHKVAINLSAQAFSNEHLLPLIREKLAQYHVDPGRIIFELTESASLSNIDATQHMIQQLNELGCAFSIDDFGTGFSTFSYLKKLPAQSVKIDGSFVKDMVNDPVDQSLVKAIVDITKALRRHSVAEFVENAETLKLLRELNVDYAQGYFIARPMDIEKLQQWYREYQ